MEVESETSAIAGIRRFQSIAEIEQHAGFAHANPIQLDNYLRLLGWYAFEAEELTCCVQAPSGSLCETRHRKGWMAQLKDGSATIVGNVCAAKKFGADATIMRDISRAENEIDRLDTEGRIRGLLVRRDEKIAEIRLVLAQLLDLKDSLGRYRREFGSAAWGKLEEMARLGRGRVEVTGVTPALHDEHGELVRKRIEIAVPVGTVAGIRVCNPSAVPVALAALQGLAKRYSGEIDASRKAQVTKAVRALNAALADHPRLISEAQRLLEDGLSFGKNDFSLLCFLVADKSERPKLARLALSRAGKEVGRDAAKQWLAQWDAALCQRHGVKSLRI